MSNPGSKCAAAEHDEAQARTVCAGAETRSNGVIRRLPSSCGLLIPSCALLRATTSSRREAQRSIDTAGRAIPSSLAVCQRQCLRGARRVAVGIGLGHDADAGRVWQRGSAGDVVQRRARRAVVRWDGGSASESDGRVQRQGSTTMHIRTHTQHGRGATETGQMGEATARCRSRVPVVVGRRHVMQLAGHLMCFLSPTRAPHDEQANARLSVPMELNELKARSQSVLPSALSARRLPLSVCPPRLSVCRSPVVDCFRSTRPAIGCPQFHAHVHAQFTAIIVSAVACRCVPPRNSDSLALCVSNRVA